MGKGDKKEKDDIFTYSCPSTFLPLCPPKWEGRLVGSVRRIIFKDFSIPKDTEKSFPSNSEVLLSMGHCTCQSRSKDSKEESTQALIVLSFPLCRHLAQVENVVRYI